MSPTPPAPARGVALCSTLAPAAEATKHALAHRLSATWQLLESLGACVSWSVVCWNLCCRTWNVLYLIKTLESCGMYCKPDCTGLSNGQKNVSARATEILDYLMI